MAFGWVCQNQNLWEPSVQEKILSARKAMRRRKMKAAHLTTAVLLTILSSSCSGFMASPPNPDEYERWSKPGVDQITEWKTMLECNFASPFAVAEEFSEGERTDEDVVRAIRCMEAQGFRNDYTFPYCGSAERLRLLACAPSANIPRPDIETRLNSGYCKKYPQSPACVP